MIICCVHAGGPSLRFGYLGGDHPNDVDPDDLSPTGGEANHREATKAMAGWGMAVSPNSGGAKGGGD